MVGMTVEEMGFFLENWLKINSLAIAEDVSSEIGPYLQPEDQRMIKIVIDINQKLFIKWMPLFLVSLLAANSDSIGHS
jgi:hypothetical protein